MKRLVVTGLPCPSESWEKFLGKRRGQRIIPIREVFEHCSSPDPRDMSRYISEEIKKFRPESIVCHDLGVPLTLMALLRLQRRGSPLRPKVTVFNGAFRGVSLVRANHIFKVQFMSRRRIIQDVEAHGGDVDPALTNHLSRIRAMYRLIALFRLSEQLSAALRLDDLMGIPGGLKLKSPLQVIASPSDPYIPIDAVRRLGDDFAADRYVEVDYGHFPYSVAREKILPLIEHFEASVLSQ